MSELPKRTWHYVQSPKIFEVSPCSCGNVDTEWSEYKDHLWCDKCQKDFVPEHHGLFDGPIMVKLCQLLGISFDRINLETGHYEQFDVETLEYKANLKNKDHE